MAERRALELDSLAVGDRFKLFNFTRRDDHVAYLWVLRAVDRLREVHQVQVDAEQLAAALRELAGEFAEVPAIDGNLRDRLDALHDDGVLLRFDDPSRAGSLVRYRNRQSVYQFSELGYWAYTSVEGVLAARVQDANLSRLVFSDILEDLRALAAANRAGEAEQVYRRLSRLDEVVADMGRRSARFHVTLGEIMQTTDTSPETFLRHKNALLTHMTEFTAELDRYLPRLGQAVGEVEDTGLMTLLDRAAGVDDRPFVDFHDRVEEWRRRWAVLRAWFARDGQADSRADELRSATRIAVSGVIALLRQITETRRGGVNQASQLRHLARWVWDAPDEDAAHALMGAAFNLRSVRHLGAAHDDEEQISSRSTWWDAPGVEVAVPLFRSGKSPTTGVPAPVKGNSGAQRELRRRQAADRAAERDAAAHLADVGVHDRVLDDVETGVLLKLMTKALEGRTVVAGRLRGASGSNDALLVRMVPADTGSTVRTTQGTLHLPGVRVELRMRGHVGRAPVGRENAEVVDGRAADAPHAGEPAGRMAAEWPHSEREHAGGLPAERPRAGLAHDERPHAGRMPNREPHTEAPAGESPAGQTADGRPLADPAPSSPAPTGNPSTEREGP